MTDNFASRAGTIFILTLRMILTGIITAACVAYYAGTEKVVALYDWEKALSQNYLFASLVIVSAGVLALGWLTYWTYRALVFNTFIIWIRDCLFKMTVRNFLKKEYDFGGGRFSLSASQKADRFHYSLPHESTKMSDFFLRLQASAIHMFYIAGIQGIGFGVAALLQGNFDKAFGFGLIAFFFVVGLLADHQHERIEIAALQQHLLSIDSDAAEQGYRRKSS